MKKSGVTKSIHARKLRGNDERQSFLTDVSMDQKEQEFDIRHIIRYYKAIYGTDLDKQIHSFIADLDL